MVIAIPSRCFADEAFRQSSGVIEKWVRVVIRVKADDLSFGGSLKQTPAEVVAERRKWQGQRSPAAGTRRIGWAPASPRLRCPSAA